MQVFKVLISHQLEVFKGIVDNVRGFASGRANIVGPLEDPEIDGVLYLNNAGLKVPYLNVDYNFDKNSIIDLTEEQFILEILRLKMLMKRQEVF